jgi:hypothetical protein
VAEDFANRWYRTSKGGSALIRVQAPPEAIICAPWQYNNRFAEREYLVDRLTLARWGIKVDVLERFPQMTHEEHARLGSADASLFGAR